MITATLAIAVMTWYGGPFIGEHHAAHWHGQSPLCAPDVVDYQYPGVAACTDYEFGDILRFESNGRVAYGVVVDRRARHGPEYCLYFDAWPFLAERLGFGPGYGSEDVGVVEASATRFDKISDSYYNVGKDWKPAGYRKGR